MTACSKQKQIKQQTPNLFIAFTHKKIVS
ncbi:hypothetical protein R3I93_005034 [Phoxinus phoxinus]|uniref:Uncharacterized protein n=1 Tax=Phoxinus phoxinus TaxID=58324 RepID=A0AAN9DBM9_9TELE